MYVNLVRVFFFNLLLCFSTNFEHIVALIKRLEAKILHIYIKMSIRNLFLTIAAA